MSRQFDNFDEFADDYQEKLDAAVRFSGAESGYFHRQKVGEVRACESPRFGGRFLDFGCGDGLSLELFSQAFPQAQLCGTDVSQRSLQVASRRVPQADLRPFDGVELPHDDQSFEVVFTSMVFHHIEPRLHARTLSELHRVLAPGGRLYVFEHNPWNPLTRKVVADCEFDRDAILLSMPRLRKALLQAKFRALQARFILFVPPTPHLNWLRFLDRWLFWCPLGAQYYFRALKINA